MYVIITSMATPKRQNNVLVVCDDRAELEIISSLMEKVDFHVLTAVTAPDQASRVHEFVQRGEMIDLAIIDVGKARADSEELLHSLHQNYPKLRLVLMLSGSEGHEAEVGPIGHVRGYLHKPVRKAQLLGTVMTVMDAPSALVA
jgi:CheY-like chemotaxis protein